MVFLPAARTYTSFKNTPKYSTMLDHVACSYYQNTINYIEVIAIDYG